MKRTTGQTALIVNLLVLFTYLGAGAGVQAQPKASTTKVLVRAVAQDAKIMHDPVGGARITVREKATGRILARGIQEGGSGNTQKIMQESRVRGKAIYNTPGAAQYVASLRLSQPTVVEITAKGPLAYPQAMQQTSKTMLLMPGEDVMGDGVVLTLHGFIVELQGLSAQERLRAGQTVNVRAKVRMMCGCPTKPEGVWDAQKIDIQARLVQDGEVVRSSSMEYAGEPSSYKGALTVPKSGTFELQVVAIDAGRVNFGIDRQEIVVR